MQLKVVKLSFTYCDILRGGWKTKQNVAIFSPTSTSFRLVKVLRSVAMVVSALLVTRISSYYDTILQLTIFANFAVIRNI